MNETANPFIKHKNLMLQRPPDLQRERIGRTLQPFLPTRVRTEKRADIDQQLKESEMEQLNKAELMGNVGIVHINTVGDRRVIRFSLATNLEYRASDGSTLMETTWHSVSAWEGNGMPDFDLIRKGIPLRVVGRIKNGKYTAQDGTEKYSSEIIASIIEFPEESLTAQSA